MTGPGQVLFEFVRHWSRRSDATTAPEQGRLVLVAEAVHALEKRGLPATVNAVADEIGIDQSGASRLIKSAIEAGHLGTAASGDGRRRPVTVTAAGHEMLAHAHEWQEQVFDRLTEGWPQRRRREFERAMSELMERSYTAGP
ncbi:MarR family winged helix-turn-helix transcriptional regulator [Paractinoplanes lichenicola]|uniref:Winged helix-turn-helix transcriptional regulator n=1 Tax=Paractinoplanes lichenicola TaxID=2802976 RepID=A0ABS1VWM3_9ACTN|nr:MarR family winged helix-turn-helix transcriptional regulator [Actinoplanes lichenicola]MBL7258891.1 winged helix-turn-helix transcriptional regulator [Actinoplanes lichenicola]